MSEVIETVNPHWDVFTPPLLDRSTTEYEYVEYREKNVNVNGLPQYELVNQDLDLFLLPSESFIQVKCIIRDQANAIIPSGDVALQNSGYSLFDKAYYYMNDQAVENLDYVGMMTHVKHLCSASKECEQSLEQQGLILDRGYGGPTNKLTFTNVTAAGRTPTVAIVANAAAAANWAIGGNGAAGVPAKPARGRFLLGGVAVADDDVITFSINGNLIKFYADTYTFSGLSANNAPTDVNIRANYVTKGIASIDIPILGVAAGGFYFAQIGGDDIVNRSTYLRMIDSVTGREVMFTINGHPAMQAFVPQTVALNAPIEYCCIDGYTPANGDPVGIAYVDEVEKNYINGRPYSNSGFNKRKFSQFYSGANYSKKLTLMLPLWKLFPIFESNHHVFRGVKHTIRLYKQQIISDIILRSPSTPVIGNVSIEYISWWVPVLKPTIRVGLELDKQLSGGEHKVLAWNGCQLFKSNPFDANATSGSYRITSTAHRPTRIVAFFQRTNRLNSQTENGRLFDSLLNAAGSGVIRAHIRVGGTQYPRDEYQTQFTSEANRNNEDLGRVYAMYLSICGFEKDSDKGAPISYNEFRDLYPMWVFDMSAQDEQIWVNITSLDLEFRWVLGGDAAGQFIVWTYVEYQREMVLSGINSRMAIKL